MESKQMRLKRTLRGLAAVLVLGAVAAPAWAQGDIRSVTHVRVKRDRTADFQAAVRDMIELHKKAGASRAFTTWSSATGPSEFVVVSHMAKFADMDQTMDPKMKDHQFAMAAIGARLNSCAESMETEIHTMVPELTSPMGATPPPFVRTIRTTAAPGKVNDVLEVYKTDLAPAWKKAGITAYGVARIRYGAPSNQVHTFTAMKGWADLDGPPPVETAMGTAAYQQFMTKVRAITLRTEYTIYRYRASMSYIPAQ
jgi:quinol monooxygenase YgiN